MNFVSNKKKYKLFWQKLQPWNDVCQDFISFRLFVCKLRCFGIDKILLKLRLGFKRYYDTSFPLKTTIHKWLGHFNRARTDRWCWTHWKLINDGCNLKIIFDNSKVNLQQIADVLKRKAVHNRRIDRVEARVSAISTALYRSNPGGIFLVCKYQNDAHKKTDFFWPKIESMGVTNVYLQWRNLYLVGRCYVDIGIWIFTKIWEI